MCALTTKNIFAISNFTISFNNDSSYRLINVGFNSSRVSTQRSLNVVLYTLSMSNRPLENIGKCPCERVPRGQAPLGC